MLGGLSVTLSLPARQGDCLLVVKGKLRLGSCDLGRQRSYEGGGGVEGFCMLFVLRGGASSPPQMRTGLGCGVASQPAIGATGALRAGSAEFAPFTLCGSYG